MPSSENTLENRLGHPFKNQNLLECALTHASFSTPHEDNQRLEFLGDAVLDLLIAERLYREHPEVDEGGLDRMRASLVNGRSLAQVARQLKLGEALRVSEAQRRHRPEASDAMLEDALEALLGAVFLDGGLEAARSVIAKIFAPAFEDPANLRERNPKSRLQEWTQGELNGQTPHYEELATEGPAHDRHYSCAVHIDGKEHGRGRGRSKKAAECAAAEAALEALQP